jgi:hypothetical protein
VSKKPKIAKSPQPTKTPKFANDKKIRGAPLVWRFSHADRGGPFSWAAMPSANKLADIIERLAAFETMTDSDIAGSGSHSIELHQLSKEAQTRLVEIQHDDLDEIYSLRITGAERVICIHMGNIMRVLWYDPDHKVCPSKLKHT